MNTNSNNFLRIIKKFIYIVILGITYTNLLSFTPPYSGQYNRIASDYGPRRYTNTQGVIIWDFHPAIDYNPKDGDADYGDPIRAVETGEIAKIELLGTAGWTIEIHSPSIANVQRKWRYLHLFGNKNMSNPRVAGDFELIGDKNIGYSIRNNLTSVTFEVGDTVHEGEEFAPTGNSGGDYKVHLDIRLNWIFNTDYGDNPLIYLNHGTGTVNYNKNGEHINMTDTVPIVNIENPPANYVFMQQDLTTKFPIKVTVNTEDCLDLDELDLWIYKNEKEENPAENWVHIGKAGEPTFRYGGKINENRGQTIRDYDETNKITGVRAITLNEDGKDRFIYYQTFKDLNLPAGKHKLVVIAEDVNGHTSSAQSSFYIVPSDYALYHSDTILPTPGPTGTPVAGTQYTNVVVKDLKQEPTEEPTEASGTVTPARSAVPSPTPEPEIKVMSIDNLKGVLLALVGNADFSDEKYI